MAGSCFRVNPVDLSAGGTIFGDLIITGDLTVQGSSIVEVDSTVQGQLIIDTDNIEALLVRADGDLGDIFIVDTINETVVVSGTDQTGFPPDTRTLLIDTGDRVVTIFGTQTRPLLVGRTANAGFATAASFTNDIGGPDRGSGIDFGITTFPMARLGGAMGVSTAEGYMRFDTRLGGVLAEKMRLTKDGDLQFGSTPSQSGRIRLQNADAIFFRNFEDDGDLDVLSFTDSNVLRFGQTGVLEVIHGAPVNEFNGQVLIEGEVTPFEVRNSSRPFFTVETNTQTIKIVGTLNHTGGGPLDGSASTSLKMISAIVGMSGPTGIAVGLIPAGSFVIGVTTRALSLLVGPTGYDVGDGVDVDRWGNSISTVSGTTSDITDFTSSAHINYPAANDVVITSDGVDFTSGNIRVTVHYMTLIAPLA